MTSAAEGARLYQRAHRGLRLGDSEWVAPVRPPDDHCSGVVDGDARERREPAPRRERGQPAMREPTLHIPIIERSRAVSRDFCPPENLRRHDRFGRPLAPLAAPRLAGGCRRVRSSLPAGLSGGLRCEPAASLPRRRVLRASSESPVSQPPQPYLPVHTLPGARTDPAASRTRLSHASEMQSDSDSGLPSVLLPVGGMYCCEAPLVGGARLLAVSARRAALCGERCAPVPSLQFPRWRMSL